MDGSHVDEGVSRLRVGEIPLGKDLRVELLLVPEVLALEARAVDLVDLIELLARLGFEGRKGSNGLGREKIGRAHV